MRRYFRQLGAVVWKDLLVELRSGERLAAMAAFAVLVAILFHYALDWTAVRPREVAPGLIWLTVVFGGLLGLGRTFHLEEEEDALRGLVLSPIPRDALFLAKVASNYVLLLLVTAGIVAIFWLFFDLGIGGRVWVLGGVLALGILGFVAVGTLFSAVSAQSTMGETLLPILVFPVLVPVVVYGASATSRVMAGRPLAEVVGNMKMLAAFALVALAVGAVLFRFVVEET